MSQTALDLLNELVICFADRGPRMHENKELIPARLTVDPLGGPDSQARSHHHSKVKRVLLTQCVEAAHRIKLRRLEFRKSSALRLQIPS